MGGKDHIIIYFVVLLMKFHISHGSEGAEEGSRSYIFTSVQIFVCYGLVEMAIDKYCKFVLHWSGVKTI